MTIQSHLGSRAGLFDAYRDSGALWRCVVSLEEGRRLHDAEDFLGSLPVLLPDLIIYDLRKVGRRGRASRNRNKH